MVTETFAIHPCRTVQGFATDHRLTMRVEFATATTTALMAAESLMVITSRIARVQIAEIAEVATAMPFVVMLWGRTVGEIVTFGTGLQTQMESLVIHLR